MSGAILHSINGEILKPQALNLTLAAGAVALLIAGCGGGGGGGTAEPSLQLSGTAATGAALAGAAVEVKCAAGTGTATTAANGTYSLTIANGALPCIIQVKTPAGGATSTLHSVIESGTLNAAGDRTTAVANVTPVTELIVAHAAAAMPEASFQGFTAGAFTREQVQASSTTIVTALHVAGIDLGAINPVTAALVARTASGPGNAYDQMLDALAAKVDGDELKAMARQVADAAQAKFADGVKSAVLAGVGGAMPGCPAVVSGMYRTADVFGHVDTYAVDFGKMQMVTAGSSEPLVLTADPVEGCVFTASGPLLGTTGTLKVAIGANGIGNFRSDIPADHMFDSVGVMFPAQSHSVAELRGTWSVLRTDLAGGEHSASQVTVGDGGQVSSCNYDSNWTCVTNPSTMTAVERSDGGIAIPVSATEQIALYGYRAPNGAVALFGGAKPTSNVAVLSKSFIATKLAALPVPVVGTTTRSWDAGINIDGNGVITRSALAPISYTIRAADAAAGTATRQNDVTGRIESLRFNTPLTGVRTRDAGTFNGFAFAGLVQIPLTGMGVTLSINAVPWGPTSTFIHNIAVVK
jgi:hypothetical protein